MISVTYGWPSSRAEAARKGLGTSVLVPSQRPSAWPVPANGAAMHAAQADFRYPPFTGLALEKG